MPIPTNPLPFTMTDDQILESYRAYRARGYVPRAAAHVIAVVFRLDIDRVLHVCEVA